jgi:thiamine transport system permease protein
VLVVWQRAQHQLGRLGTTRGRAPARRPRRAGERVGVAAAVTGTMGLLALPMGRLVQRSLRVGDSYGLAWYRQLRSAGAGTTRALEPGAAMTTSLGNAVVAAAVATVVGTMAAYAIALARRRAGLLDTGLMLPLGTSAVTLGLGVFLAYGRPPVDLRASPLLVPMAHALIGVPFVVRTVLPAVRAVDPRYGDAAATLGATRWHAWRTVELPLVRRALVTAAGFAAAVSLGEFGATSFLARRSTTTVPVAIVELLSRPGAANVGEAYALAVLLALATAVVFVAADAMDRRSLSGGGW